MPLFFFIEFARPVVAGENPIAGERERAGEDEKKSIPPPLDAVRCCGIGLAADIGLSREERRREEAARKRRASVETGGIKKNRSG
jgi:4-hydroxy-L-threonine phosphate dehydrogenase PdxA